MGTVRINLPSDGGGCDGGYRVPGFSSLCKKSCWFELDAQGNCPAGCTRTNDNTCEPTTPDPCQTCKEERCSFSRRVLNGTGACTHMDENTQKELFCTDGRTGEFPVLKCSRSSASAPRKAESLRSCQSNDPGTWSYASKSGRRTC